MFDSQSNYLSSTGDCIVAKDTLKDLGVLMSGDCSFSCHIEAVISKVNKMVSWALRNFECRSRLFILTIWKSILLPHLDYCSQLWSPFKSGDINYLELVQNVLSRRLTHLKNRHIGKLLKVFVCIP